MSIGYLFCLSLLCRFGVFMENLCDSLVLTAHGDLKLVLWADVSVKVQLVFW